MTKTPPKMDVADWRERIPKHLLAEAEAEGPLELDSHGETPEQAKARRQAAHEAKVAAYRARVPLMYRDATFGELDPSVAATMREWLEREGSTLMLAGPVGTGKTHAGYALLNHLAQALTVEAVTCADLLASLRPDGDAQSAERAKAADVLLLDDFGAAKASEWAVEQIVSLLDHRLRNGQRQVVTTNSPYDALVEAWDDRAMDRLRYRWTVIQMNGESRRKAAW
jgi:DNA replication protein DnaC